MNLVQSTLKRFGYVKNTPKKNTRGFNGAATNRLVEDWLTTRSTINNLLDSGLSPMRERSRDLVRQDDYAKAFRRMVVNNVVGPDGFKLELNILDDNGTVDQRAVDVIKLAWEKWCKRKNCTVAGDMSYHELCSLLAGSAPADGGFMVRMVDGYENEFGFALQPIDLDCLDESKNRSFDGNSMIRMGVEMNKWRKRLFYHIKTENPYDNYGRNKYRTEPISADDIIHAFIPLEVGQVRELPWFHTVMLKLKMLNGYDEAAVIAARIGAEKIGFIEKKPDANGNYVGDGKDSEGNRLMDSSPGSINELGIGESFNSWDPAYPHAEHGSFNKVMLRGISAGLGCAYNSLANDLEGVNYSSIRAGLLDERDQWKMLQRWMCVTLHEPVFERWLVWAMNTGQVKLPPRKFDKFNRPYFQGRRWAWVDPMKDIQAKVLAIDNLLETRTDVIAEAGGSIEEFAATAENEAKLLASRNLKTAAQKDQETEKLKATKQSGGESEE